ncbi:hypothetical protein CRH09_29445 [Nocardia terpenica]|uniref:Chitin-binding type-4 domain-containing protein n=1 Tax=Nocardia terpenica TaxID=455432 RepID=A0A291RPZ0_9NOCA|nr:lytic polysaccharide monooxygenase auxiliary activity family 9 protein [Nocardia terpenica]ATL69681.1 hypothetical protein CRH09_29445 [Nocardia terpenica]
MRVTTPPARSESADLAAFVREGLDAAKFFPATIGGLTDQFRPEDVPSADDPGRTPPRDGAIASTGQPNARVLDEPGAVRWRRHAVGSGDTITVRWSTGTPRKVRRFNFFCTHPDWDPEQPLSRLQLRTHPADEFTCTVYGGIAPQSPAILGYHDPACRPFHTEVTACRAYWDPNAAKPFQDGGMLPATDEQFSLPLPHRTGYHALLCTCEVADTGLAFYSVIDLDFG